MKRLIALLLMIPVFAGAEESAAEEMAVANPDDVEEIVVEAEQITPAEPVSMTRLRNANGQGAQNR